MERKHLKVMNPVRKEKVLQFDTVKEPAAVPVPKEE